MTLLAARALCAIVADGRAMTLGCDERPLDALTLGALREIPVAATALFGTSPLVRWASGMQGPRPDITGYEPGSVEPDVLVEIKGRKALYNFPGNVEGSLDIYRRNAPQARCYVVMPECRAVGDGETVDSPGSRGRLELVRPGKEHESAEAWRIVTFEQVADTLRAHLRVPDPSLDEPDLRLLANMMRVRGLEP